MYYIFVINGRPDKAFIVNEVKAQLKDIRIDYEIYKTESEGVGEWMIS